MQSVYHCTTGGLIQIIDSVRNTWKSEWIWWGLQCRVVALGVIVQWVSDVCRHVACGPVQSADCYVVIADQWPRGFRLQQLKWFTRSLQVVIRHWLKLSAKSADLYSESAVLFYRSVLCAVVNDLTLFLRYCSLFGVRDLQCPSTVLEFIYCNSRFHPLMTFTICWRKCKVLSCAQMCIVQDTWFRRVYVCPKF